jgi:hypothetical protein
MQSFHEGKLTSIPIKLKQWKLKAIDIRSCTQAPTLHSLLGLMLKNYTTHWVHKLGIDDVETRKCSTRLMGAVCEAYWKPTLRKLQYVDNADRIHNIQHINLLVWQKIQYEWWIALDLMEKTTNCCGKGAWSEDILGLLHCIIFDKLCQQVETCVRGCTIHS